MAKSTNYAAYQQLRPLQGDVSQDMQYWNEDAARRRREKQAEDQFAWRQEEAEKLRSEREAQRRREDYDKYVKPFNLTDSGSRSLNAIQAEMLSNATKQYAPLIMQLEEAQRNKDSKSEIEARVKLQELGQFADRLKQTVDIYSNFRQEAKAALDNGEIYQEEFDKWDKAFQNGFQGIRGGMDENFKPVIAFVDQDGDGVNDVTDVKGFDSIADYSALPTFLQKASLENVAKGLADIYETEKTTTDNGYRSRTTVLPKKDALSKAVHNRLFNSDGGYTDLMKSLAFSKGYGYNITPEAAKEIEDELLSSSMGMYATENVENVTPPRTSGRGNKTDEPVNLTGFNVTETDFGDYASNVDNKTYWGVNVPSKKLSPNSKPTKLVLDAPENGEDSNFMVDKFTVSNVDGNNVIVVSGNYVTDEGTTNEVDSEDGESITKVKNPETRKRAEIVLSESEVNELSNWLGKDPFSAATRPKKEEETTDKPTFPEWKKANPNGTWADYQKL